MRTRVEQRRDGCEHQRDAEDARLVRLSAEVTDEDDEADVDAVVDGADEARLGAAQAEPALDRPHDSVVVDEVDHIEEEDRGQVGDEERQAVEDTRR